MTDRIETLMLDADGGDVAFAVVCVGPSGPLGTWPLPAGGSLTVGRLGTDADIALPSGVVSAHHGRLGVVGASVFYRDEGSANGTYMAGDRIGGAVQLREGDVLEFVPVASPSDVALRLVLLGNVVEAPTWRQVPFGPDVQEVVFGRGHADGGASDETPASGSGVSLDDAYVSERHASFFHSAKGLYVLDFMSANGVWVNGARIEGSAPVTAGSIVRLGASVVYVGEGELWVGESPAPAPERAAQPQPQSQPQPQLQPQSRPEVPAVQGGLAIDIEEKNVWSRVKRKTLLRDVRLNVAPGDFVLVLGGSGAGKTTFLKAVMGYDKAEGSIRLGDVDVYEEYERVKYQIGYVPQQDLLRMNDSVHDTLLAAARLRMPAHSTLPECEERARWAADLLGLMREGDTLVGRLSGGQRKRLSIAVELVGDPALFFLDEPDSGLDGVMARSLLENLRSIADLGKMVLVITHGPDRGAALFSKVLVLAKSDRDGAGHLVFYGPVAEAREFFGVESLEDVVRRINRPDEGGEGLADHYIDKWEGR